MYVIIVIIMDMGYYITLNISIYKRLHDWATDTGRVIAKIILAEYRQRQNYYSESITFLFYFHNFYKRC